MLILLSPAKSLDYDTPPTLDFHTVPDMVKESSQLVDLLRELTVPDVATLMDLSDKLASLNVGRFGAWKPRFTAKNSKQAVLAFNGDVYDGLNATTLSEAELMWAQDHLRILSGLYGLLRPLDWMQPYRLEMGTRLDNPRGKDLYAWWGTQITEAINAVLRKDAQPLVVNLASQEYFKSVKPKLLKAPIIDCVFEDWKSGQWKVISFHAKRARGLMARHIIQRRATEANQLLDFAADGYQHDASASTATSLVFRRKLAA
ncbi:MAG: hypothetical protein RI920_1452 [Pseudomonadota bacterium]|jgi:cytoplasmic iron level regulating protein YaaA (DUF328/UPF0246 family)